MNTAKPSAVDEEAFMADLLSGANSSFWDAPSPDPTPKKRKRPTRDIPDIQPTKTISQGSIESSREPKIHQSSCSAEDIAALLEGAEDWDWDDMLSPVKKKPTINALKAKVDDPVFRCIVKSVDHRGSSKILHVSSEDKLDSRRVILEDDWVETDIKPDDIINVIGHFSLNDRTATVSSKCNLLIQHPDILMTATSISNAPHCTRRPLLSLLLRSSTDKSPALVWGNMLHEAMQRCLSTGRWDVDSIQTFIGEIIQKGLNDLVQIDVGVEEARTEIDKRASGLKIFGEKYLGDIPKRDALLLNARAAPDSAAQISIKKLHDVEEEIWAPKYGLKGKIDASVMARIDETAGLKREGQLVPPHSSTSTIPLEIKTGRAGGSMEHRAQTILYTLLMSERYGTSLPTPSSNSTSPVSVPGGLLFYTQSEDVTWVPTGWNELRALIIARNELASYLMKRAWGKKRSKEGVIDKNDTTQLEDERMTTFLPPTINQERSCGRCYVADACMLYRKAVEGVEDHSSPIAELYKLKTGHLSDGQLAFFKNWENLISLEEQDMTRFRKELWTLGASEREKMGRCLADMVLDTSFIAHDAAKYGKIHRYTYRFVRRKQSDIPQSLLHGHISSGDPVTVSVSDDPRLLALARGFVLELTPLEIIIGVDHTLSTEFINARRPCYSGKVEIVFRIDKDEMMSGMGRVRDNLAQLFYVSSPRRLLEQVVDLKRPEFDMQMRISTDLGLEGLNVSQQQALEQSLRARDYALILGMPGTGKTTTVALMIKALVEMGKTVLLTSYTHSAVDTILLKLKNNANFEILRLGNKDKVHPDIQELTLSARRTPDTVEQLENELLRPPVVATTALSTDHALFSRRRFDYCIVDEASQITLPTCIGPLRYADKFVLVGDHFQLPPLVKSKEARKGGFDISLFRRLSDAHPCAVVDLAYQYRMNADIMHLSNRLIYSDRLKCGSDEVANRSLDIPNTGEHSCAYVLKGDSCWIERLMDQSCKAVFVDTDALPALDSRVGDLVQNEIEASLIQQLTVALLEGGVREEQIGIISLYRQQIKLISHLLIDHKGIELLTADRSQGRDKDCIIISLVRANEDNQIGDLLKDWRRINVAFTRARTKLVIFGSRKTLKASSLLSEFFKLMEERNWVLTLPEGAHAVHFKAPKGSSSNADRQNSQAHPKKIKKATVENGLARTRPILQDLMNESK